jgi:pimeloyl-ACP methyl ester carboxylesterase
VFREVRGHRLNIVSFGSDGTPLVFIGGWIGTWQVWLQVIELLSPRRRCVAYDHRGAGQSPAPVAALTPDGMVDDVFGVLDALSIECCVLIGESQGGFVAAMAALRDPSRFAALGIVDSTPVNEPSPTSDAFAAMLDEDADSPLTPFVELCIPEPDCQHVRRWLLSLLRESDPVARPALIRQMYGVDLRDQLGHISLPTIVLHGENDAIWPADAGRTFAHGIPAAELTVIPNTGHVPMMTKPHETAASLSDFLDRVAPVS